MWLHSVLSVSISGVPFGLFDQRLWHEPGGDTVSGALRDQNQNYANSPEGERGWLESLKHTEAAFLKPRR
jgi:hypothetical protein